MQVAPPESALLACEYICGAKVKTLHFSFLVNLKIDNLEVKVVSDDTLHQEGIEFLGPLILVHVSFYLFLDILHCGGITLVV